MGLADFVAVRDVATRRRILSLHETNHGATNAHNAFVIQDSKHNNFAHAEQ